MKMMTMIIMEVDLVEEVGQVEEEVLMEEEEEVVDLVMTATKGLQVLGMTLDQVQVLTMLLKISGIVVEFNNLILQNNLHLKNLAIRIK